MYRNVLYFTVLSWGENCFFFQFSLININICLVSTGIFILKTSRIKTDKNSWSFINKSSEISNSYLKRDLFNIFSLMIYFLQWYTSWIPVTLVQFYFYMMRCTLHDPTAYTEYRKELRLCNKLWSSITYLFPPLAEYKEFERRFKFKPRLKYGWFRLNLYQMFQDLTRRLI